MITKLDLMDEGTDARDILENRVLPLRRGNWLNRICAVGKVILKTQWKHCCVVFTCSISDFGLDEKIRG